jgi:hypothetical protein
MSRKLGGQRSETRRMRSVLGADDHMLRDGLPALSARDTMTQVAGEADGASETVTTAPDALRMGTRPCSYAPAPEPLPRPPACDAQGGNQWITGDRLSAQ